MIYTSIIYVINIYCILYIERVERYCVPQHLVGLAGEGAKTGLAVGIFEISASLILILLGMHLLTGP
jgi:hypothetical protein